MADSWAMTGELGGFPRARRGWLQPGDVGLPAGAGPRRTAGLRREEAAALAGVGIDYCPAYVLNHVDDVLAADPEALALLAGPGDWPPDRRNTVRYTFLHPGARALYENWEQAGARHVAHQT